MNYTVCYLKNLNNKYLFLYRNKKKHDLNKGMHIGIGGKVEPGETIYDCNKREVFEETGININVFSLLGVVKYVDHKANIYQAMYVFYSEDFIINDNDYICDEGDLYWLSENEFYEVRHFKGDEYFMKYVFKKESFGIFCCYYDGQDLIRVLHNGIVVL